MTMRAVFRAAFIAVTSGCVVAAAASVGATDTIAILDTQFQAAVKANDVQVIDRILYKDMILVHGDGTTSTRSELLQEAHDQTIAYEQQVEDPGTQIVHVWVDTAVVTARLWVKGVRHDGTAFNRRVWFSDIYIRTPAGWRYAFGQVSLPLPDAASSSAQ